MARWFLTAVLLSFQGAHTDPMGLKRIFAIRHGESEWNVLHKKYPSEKDRYHERMWKVDCDITPLGQAQAQKAGEELLKLMPSVDLLVISPLRRALQTAGGILSVYPNPPRTIEVWKEAAEILIDPCDIGNEPQILQKEFPNYDFRKLPDFWWHGGKSSKETLEAMIHQRNGLETETHAQRRIESLKEMLRKRKEEFIVVVCHSDTIWWLTRRNKDGEHVGEKTENGEILDITSFVLDEKETM